jgi:p-aminobenzoyl-glutamate transporter AbgT
MRKLILTLYVVLFLLGIVFGFITCTLVNNDATDKMKDKIKDLSSQLNNEN